VLTGNEERLRALNAALGDATLLRVRLGRCAEAIGVLAFAELAQRYDDVIARYAVLRETLSAEILYEGFVAHDIARFVDLVENYCYDGAQLLRRAEDLRHAL